MEAQKPNPTQPQAVAGQAQKSKVRGIKNAFLVIIACFVVAVCLFLFFFGGSSHFSKVQLQNVDEQPLFVTESNLVGKPIPVYYTATTENAAEAEVYDSIKAKGDSTLVGKPIVAKEEEGKVIYFTKQDLVGTVNAAAKTTEKYEATTADKNAAHKYTKDEAIALDAPELEGVEEPAYYSGSMMFAPEYASSAHPQDLVGTVFKGGFIVPILLTLLLTVIALSVERAIALSSAKGKGSISKFVADVKKCLAKNDIAGAQKLCKAQGGSVAAVVSAGLNRYEEMDKNTVLTKEQKVATLQKEIEEAMAIEMPSLQQNLPIVATLTTLGTLVGLLGTVIGMIKSFQALSASGAPDSTELSTGISEALINTAFGIGTGALAVISYNFYTNKIDNLTYAIDEIGFSIVQSFAATH